MVILNDEKINLSFWVICEVKSDFKGLGRLIFHFWVICEVSSDFKGLK